jgi:hypothetical protein
LLLVHDSLIARNVNAERYIREEFDWIRSALPPARRKDYLDIKRTGRNYGLEANYRRPLIDVWKHGKGRCATSG